MSRHLWEQRPQKYSEYKAAVENKSAEPDAFNNFFMRSEIESFFEKRSKINGGERIVTIRKEIVEMVVKEMCRLMKPRSSLGIVQWLHSHQCMKRGRIPRLVPWKKKSFDTLSQSRTKFNLTTLCCWSSLGFLSTRPQLLWRIIVIALAWQWGLIVCPLAKHRTFIALYVLCALMWLVKSCTRHGLLQLRPMHWPMSLAIRTLMLVFDFLRLLLANPCYSFISWPFHWWTKISFGGIVVQPRWPI